MAVSLFYFWGSQDSYSYYKLWMGGNKMSNDYDYDEEDWISKRVKFIDNIPYTLYFATNNWYFYKYNDLKIAINRNTDKMEFGKNVDSILKKSIDNIKRREESLCYGILPNMWSMGKRNNL